MTGQGLVCVGDSIIAAERSWGHRLADAGGWPLVRLAARGARSWQVVDQLPGLDGHRHAVGALTVGANDVLFDWDGARFEAHLRNILEAMTSACDRVLLQTLPWSFRRFPGSSPARRAATAEANRLLVAVVAEVGGEIVDGSDLAGRLLRPDRVHPSVLGHRLLADRAAQILGLEIRPSALGGSERNADGRGRYLAVTARTTLRELLARVTHPEPLS